MPGPIKRNLEQSGIFITRFMSGVYQNRSPLFTPISAMGMQMISRQDTLWDGLNMEISPAMTLKRRAGFPRYCSTQFSSSDWPQNFYSFKNLAGTLWAMVDTPTHVYSFTTSTLTSVFAKASTARVSFTKVANQLYMCDGNDTDKKKWDGTTLTNWGIATPVTAPTLSFSAGSLHPTSGYQWCYVYRNSTTGHISSASPLSANTGPQTATQFTVQGASSVDTQANKVDIYRTNDGGSIFYFLAEVNNGGTWSFTDNLPDSSLNNDLIAPTAHVNDPPPAGISLVVWHAGRLWAASANVLYFSGGPDTTNGVGAEAWPPANNLPAPGLITGLASTSQGLVVFTSDNAYVVYGQDALSFTVPQIWQKNFGIPNPNCVAQDGDLLFIYTSRGQLFQFGGSLTEIGFPIQAKLGAFSNYSNVSIALHRSGGDEGLFVSDGSTNLWRYSVSMTCWSPVAQPVGGCNLVSSIEVSSTNWRLLLGRVAGSGYILDRDTTVFADDGNNYGGNATVGSLTVAPPHQTATVNAVLLDTNAVGTYPTVSILMNEVSGTFVPLPNPVPDPASYAGTAYESKTVTMKRHDLKAATTPIPQDARHLQVKITLATEAQPTEIWSLGVD